MYCTLHHTTLQEWIHTNTQDTILRPAADPKKMDALTACCSVLKVLRKCQKPRLSNSLDRIVDDVAQGVHAIPLSRYTWHVSSADTYQELGTADSGIRDLRSSSVSDSH